VFELARFDATIFEPFVFELALLPLDGMPIGCWREQEHALCGARAVSGEAPMEVPSYRRDSLAPRRCSLVEMNADDIVGTSQSADKKVGPT
jgi:hypothetical protein